MKSIKAERKLFKVEGAKVADYLSDMHNFRQIMPEQIEDWGADEKSCSFFIKNLGKLGMTKGEVVEKQKFEFPSSESSKVNFTLYFHFQNIGNDNSEGFFELKADMNPMIEMMAHRPLTNFVNILTENFQAQISK